MRSTEGVRVSVNAQKEKTPNLRFIREILQDVLRISREGVGGEEEGREQASLPHFTALIVRHRPSLSPSLCSAFLSSLLHS